MPIHVDEEPRLMGALPLIIRGWSQKEVLVIPDEAKPEMAALTYPLLFWTGMEDRAIGFPGGGRQHPNGVPETLWTTLSREIKEEVSRDIRSLAPKGTARQFPYPFVVGQAPPAEDEEVPVINQIAVTSLLLPFSKFSRPSRVAMDAAVHSGKGFWMSIELLFKAAQSPHKAREHVQGLPYRPQVLTAAFLWYLSMEKGETRDQLIERTVFGNREIIAQLSTASENLKRPIRNGTMNEKGELVSLPQRDRHFLIGKVRRF